MECVLVYIYVVLFLMVTIATLASCDICSALRSTNIQRCLEVNSQRKASGAPTFRPVGPSPALAADPHPPSLLLRSAKWGNSTGQGAVVRGSVRGKMFQVSFLPPFQQFAFQQDLASHPPFIKQSNESETVACFCLQHRPRREL